jgi:geranylgeranyl diphosphate synthase type I
MGAAIANAPQSTLNALSSYGLALGEAFQLRDDLLGVFGDTQTTGKPSGDDLREGKQTMLIAKARELASAQQIALIDSKLGNPNLTEHEVSQIQEVLTNCGAQQEIESRISSQLEIALNSLSDLSPEAKHALTELAVMATKREK